MDSAVPPFWTSYGQLIGRVVDAHARVSSVPSVLSDRAVTVTISLVTNRQHAARMALQKRFSKVRKQFVDC
jgi:hypothetical protein